MESKTILKNDIYSWSNLIYSIKNWDKKTRTRIMQKCNPAEKRLIDLLSSINPEDKNTWIDFNGQEMKEIISGCHDYYNQNRKKGKI